MKKIIFLFVVTVLCLAAVSSVQAYTSGGALNGQFMIGSTSVAGSTLSVSLSNNVYLYYNGESQSYGAATKNKAGDKQYATGGGQTADSGIYYIIDTAVGVGSTNITDPTNSFIKSTGWTAQ